MAMLKMKLLSSLEKVFLHKEPAEKALCVQGFRNEVMTFQVAYTLDEPITRMYVTLEVDSPICEYIHVRQVEHVPVRYAAPLDSDDYFLSKEPGLYPRKFSI
ncbi:MAG: hypothetical protein IJO46_02150 [Thermoguttaceae bacterium]|nr:hypothetical protein [Thermoguttaceae bacterium]